MLSCDDEGSLGLMLNQRASLDVSELPDWVASADDILIGGPVSPNGLIGLCGSDPSVSGAELVAGLTLMDLDDLEAECEEGSDGLPTSWRLFAGYCGWGEGQLAAELERGDWTVLPRVEGDILNVAPEEVWVRVLGRQPHPLRLWATMPNVPEMN